MKATRRWLPRALLLVVLAAPSCSLIGGGGGYQVTAYFERAVALYPFGHVNAMGISVGRVDAVEIEDTRVRVEMTINDDVPLPADDPDTDAYDGVRATIAPLTLIGERNVVLFSPDDRGRVGPPWTQALEDAGAERAGDGYEIPLEVTIVPVEPDEALAAFDELARAVDPDAVTELVTSAANATEGQGQNFNALLGEASELTTNLAELDNQLVDAAANLHVLASAVNSREQQLSSLINSFSEATAVLASEREGIASFLDALVRLTNEGTWFLDTFENQLPGDVAIVTQLVATLVNNTESLRTLLAAFPAVTDILRQGYDTDRGMTILNVLLAQSANEGLAPLIEDVLGVDSCTDPLLQPLLCP